MAGFWPHPHLEAGASPEAEAALWHATPNTALHGGHKPRQVWIPQLLKLQPLGEVNVAVC